LLVGHRWPIFVSRQGWRAGLCSRVMSRRSHERIENHTPCWACPGTPSARWRRRAACRDSVASDKVKTTPVRCTNRMNAVNLATLVLWAVFVIYWFAASIGAKQNVGSRFISRAIGGRLAIFVAVFLVLRVPAARQAIKGYQAVPINPILQILGLILCAAGMAF